MNTEIVKAGAELAIWQDTGKMEVLRNSVCRDHTDLETRFFLEYCDVRGFNPFSRMIYSTIRTNARGVRSQTFQTGIDGMRSQAETTKKYRGQLGPFWCGPDGAWKDIWLDDVKAPYAAKVGVLREDFTEPMWAIAKYSEFKPTEDWMWKKMPSNQLAKCAEALALRKAFPEKLAGLYSDDEMAQAGPAEKVYHGKEYREDGPKLPGPCSMCEHQATISDGMALYCDEHKAHSAGAAILKAAAIIELSDALESDAANTAARKPAAAPPAQRITKNFSFLSEMAKLKKLNTLLYYTILSRRGFEHANEITDRDSQINTFREIRDAIQSSAALAAQAPTSSAGVVHPPADKAQAAPGVEATVLAPSQPEPTPGDVTDQFTDRIVVTAEDKDVPFVRMDSYIRRDAATPEQIETRIRVIQELSGPSVKDAIEKTLRGILF